MTLCSECSSKVNPVVAIDIDGTLSEYHRHLAHHIRLYFGLSRGPVTNDWDGRGNYEDWLGISHDQYREAKLAFRQGGFKRWSPVMPGVGELLSSINRLKRTVGLEVWITTTRPWNRLDSTDPDTRFWLDRHFPVYDHLLYHDHKYPELRRILGGAERVVAVVEDLPSMWEESCEAFGKEVSHMINRPHNGRYRSERSIQGMSSLIEFGELLEKEVVLWHNQIATGS